MGHALAETSSTEALFLEHRARIARLCRVLLVDPDEAADVAQEVFTKLARARADASRPVDWSAWLTRVAVNACRDRRRSGWWRWWRERGVGADDRHVGAVTRTPEDEAIDHETAERVWRAVARLPGRQREIFALRQLEGWPTDAVAAALGITTGTVKQHLFRAVHRLRRALEDGA